MLNTLWGVVQKESIKLLENVEIPEGTKILVTLLTDKDEQQFWQNASQTSQDAVWNNREDDIYAQLLKG
ncbi:hypothetical protein KKG61_02395 [bacterium]|nr:hypothetical protein [bacterium]MBU1598949.1 hypothetical protein [bacterium]